MNSAARLLKENTLSRTWIISFLLSRTQVSVLMLTFAILMSGLSIVYVTNTTRSANANLQHTQVEHAELQAQWGELLLEKSTLLTQTRIQQVAKNKLDMVTPDGQSMVIVNE